MGKAKRRRLRRKKGSQPRLAALGSPFQGKGLAWTLPPSSGRRCPEGAEVGWGKRYPRHKAFPAWGRLRNENTAFLDTTPFPNGEGKEAAASPQKGSQPRLAALGSPFQGKGLAWTLPPSSGRRCPEGAEVGWGKRYPRNKAFPAWGRLRNENTAFLDTTPFPNGEGKEEAASPQKKEANPASLRSAAPSKGRG